MFKTSVTKKNGYISSTDWTSSLQTLFQIRELIPVGIAGGAVAGTLPRFDAKYEPVGTFNAGGSFGKAVAVYVVTGVVIVRSGVGVGATLGAGVNVIKTFIFVADGPV